MILADWAALAVENARLYEDAATRRAEAERAVRRLEATAAIARAVGSETDLDRVLELIVKRGRALLDARSVLLLLVEGDQFHLAAGAGQVATGALGGRFPLADSAMGEVLFSGLPERIDDVPARLRMSDRNLGVAGAATALLVPLVYRNTPLGLLAAFDRFTDDPAFGDEEVRLFSPSRRAPRRPWRPPARSPRTACGTRSRRPSRSAAAGRASCTTRRCRRSGRCRCCSPRRCAGATRRPCGSRHARRSTTSAPRSRACGR